MTQPAPSGDGKRHGQRADADEPAARTDGGVATYGAAAALAALVVFGVFYPPGTPGFEAAAVAGGGDGRRRGGSAPVVSGSAVTDRSDVPSLRVLRGCLCL